MSHNINKKFAAVVEIGDTGFKLENCYRHWKIDKVLSATMERHEKEKVMEVFKSASLYLKQNADVNSVKKKDLPPVTDIEEWIRKQCPGELNIKLADNRLMGVFPDDVVLPRKYDIEIHISNLVNLSRLMRLFNANEIVIKE